ncbi:hypothetical protein ACF0H5_003584 [Mactra antiquata]
MYRFGYSVYKTVCQYSWKRNTVLEWSRSIHDKLFSSSQHIQHKLSLIDSPVKLKGVKISQTRHLSSSRMNLSPSIEFNPTGHLLVDEELEIIVKGLNKQQAVSVYAKLSEEGKHYESCAWFNADDNGIVDLKNNRSISGTYTGVSSMGLFWSMVPCPGQMEGISLTKRNLDTPFITEISVCDDHQTLDEIRDKTNNFICSTVIERWYKSPDVICHRVHEGNVRGKLYMPAGKGPFPGVIDLFGIAGGITEYRSALLASRGIISLSLPYFLYKDLPKTLGEINLDYFLEATDWLSQHDTVLPGGIGVVGVSKGGDIALIMSAYSPKIRAVININGCTFNATFPLKYSGGDITEIPLQYDKVEYVDGKFIMKNCFEFTSDDITPVWNHGAKVLNILGEDDMCSPGECITLLKKIYPKDKTNDCIVLTYPGAGHLIEPPYAPLCHASYQKAYDMYFIWGGKPEAHAFAQEDSWKNILKFIKMELTKKPVAPAKL